MLARATVIWIIGLLTLVPYGTYYLLFEAPRDQYAMLIVGILFWVFGFWALVGPILMAFKVRSVLKAIEQAGLRGNLRQALVSAETKDLAIDLIASENRIPRIVASRVYDLLLARALQHPHLSGEPPDGDAGGQRT